MLSSADLAGAPVGAIWDVAHPWLAGEEPAETWQALAPYLSHVQVKDVAERRPGATPVPPGAVGRRLTYPTTVEFLHQRLGHTAAVGSIEGGGDSVDSVLVALPHLQL